MCILITERLVENQVKREIKFISSRGNHQNKF